MTSPRINWALDDVYIGGWEINPSVYHQTFDDDAPGDDPAAWEFSPNGVVEGEGGQCLSDGLSGSAMMWPDTNNKDGSEQVQEFTTNQMIVQPDYMLQFKVMGLCEFLTSDTLIILILTSIYLILLLKKICSLQSMNLVHTGNFY